MSTSDHDQQRPSAWVQRWTPLLRPGACVLDLACGHGRHMRWFAAHGHTVTGVDRSAEALSAASAFGTVLQADIESGPWPLTVDGHPQTFDAVVVTNYLWRALFPAILDSLAPEGVLIYETFATGNESVGRPARPEFLLRHGELLQAFGALRVVAYEEGYLAEPPRFVQRLTAVRPASAPAPAPARYQL